MRPCLSIIGLISWPVGFLLRKSLPRPISCSTFHSFLFSSLGFMSDVKVLDPFAVTLCRKSDKDLVSSSVCRLFSQHHLLKVLSFL